MKACDAKAFNEEIQEKKRFEFGENWKQFLLLLDEKRIQAAELSLKEMLCVEDLRGKTFLDVGCGSGLFSLAARRLGASVRSFDYDPNSVACALHLREMFFPGDREWRIEQGSALDEHYLRSHGSFDIVYSWGVLHHTGAMWQALGNMPFLVKPGGKLFIAIYNDQGLRSRAWKVIKKTYVGMPPVFRFLIVWPTALYTVIGMTVRDIIHLRRPRVFSKSSSPRGMSIWRDVVDWVGGYPFEVASISEITGFYQQRGFVADKVVSVGRKLGCNQFVFSKQS